MVKSNEKLKFLTVVDTVDYFPTSISSLPTFPINPDLVQVPTLPEVQRDVLTSLNQSPHGIFCLLGISWSTVMYLTQVGSID